MMLSIYLCAFWASECLSCKKNEIMPFAATLMDLENVVLSEASQIKKNIIWYHLYVKSNEMIQMNLFTKQKQSYRSWNQTYGYQRGNGGKW